MGSQSDWDTMSHACQVLDELEIPYEKSRIRSPDAGLDVPVRRGSGGPGLRVIIAGAGGAAHLPGMIASKMVLPVIGVPVKSKALKGLDSLLSIVQMPGGIPVATVAIGKAGATNAGLLAPRFWAPRMPGFGKECKRAGTVSVTKCWKALITYDGERSTADEGL